MPLDQSSSRKTPFGTVILFALGSFLYFILIVSLTDTHRMDAASRGLAAAFAAMLGI